MSCKAGYDNISIEELEKQLDDAKKALVDKKYQEYKNDAHLFDYDIDFGRFLGDISYILEEAKNLDTFNDNYKMA